LKLASDLPSFLLSWRLSLDVGMYSVLTLIPSSKAKVNFGPVRVGWCHHQKAARSKKPKSKGEQKP
jgi:hypothetical protein